MRKTCPICGSKRTTKKMQQMTDKHWACTDIPRGHSEPCCDHPDFRILEAIKVLQKALKKVKVV